MPSLLTVDHVHLFHQHVMSQVRILLIDPRIMQRDKAEATTEVQRKNSQYLLTTKFTVAIKNHDVRTGGLAWVRQLHVVVSRV